jgi:hypothetical protein
MSEQHPPVDFAAVLADPSRPLIVGGQAVNIWAEIYVLAEPELNKFAPFTSHDGDIHGDRALAEVLHRRTGWSCRFFDDVRQIAVAILTKPGTADTPPLTIEVLRAVHGLNADDLGRNQVRELRPGEFYRIPVPFVLLKAKLANVATLSRENRPQDLKHVQMLLPICREYLREMHSNIGREDMTERNFLGGVAYATEVISAPAARATAIQHGLDLVGIFPTNLAASPHEKVRNFATKQLPRVARGGKV